MRPSNRQRKYSWETEDDQPQQPERGRTRRPAESSVDLALEDSAPRPKTPTKERRPPRDGAARAKKDAKKKSTGSGGLALRAAFFLLVVGGVGYLALSGVLTVEERGPQQAVDAGEVAPPSDEPRVQAVAAQPPELNAFSDAEDAPVKTDSLQAEPTPVAPPQQQPQPDAIAAPQSPPAPATPAPSDPEELAALQQETPDTATRVPVAQAPIDPAEVVALRERGQEMIRQGNIGQARLFLERAMRANDPEATFLLAQTFDPEALAGWGVLNMSTNPARARELYARARELTDSSAPPR